MFVGMNIPIGEHLELQCAGFLCSQTWGTVHILLFLCSSAFRCCFVALFPVRKEKSKHFGNSAQQQKWGQLFYLHCGCLLFLGSGSLWWGLYLAGASDLFA